MNVEQLNLMVEAMNAKTQMRRDVKNPYLVGIQRKPAHDWAVALIFGAALGAMFFWGV